jgi:hypothetical protein
MSDRPPEVPGHLRATAALPRAIVPERSLLFRIAHNRPDAYLEASTSDERSRAKERSHPPLAGRQRIC